MYDINTKKALDTLCEYLNLNNLISEANVVSDMIKEHTPSVTTKDIVDVLSVNYDEKNQCRPDHYCAVWLEYQKQ